MLRLSSLHSLRHLTSRAVVRKERLPRSSDFFSPLPAPNLSTPCHTSALRAQALSFTFVSKDHRARTLSHSAWRTFADILVKVDKFSRQVTLLMNPVKAELGNKDTLLASQGQAAEGVSPRGAASPVAGASASAPVQEHKRAAVATLGHLMRLFGPKVFESSVAGVAVPSIAAVAGLLPSPPALPLLTQHQPTPVEAAAERLLGAVMEELVSVLESAVAGGSAEQSVPVADLSAPAVGTALEKLLKELSSSKVGVPTAMLPCSPLWECARSLLGKVYLSCIEIQNGCFREH